jgi:two-component system chemotaxis response regulator CheB
MTIRVGIVDDSVVVRSSLESILGSHSDFEVVGTAGDPFEAREMIFEKEPDVLTLDVEMPRLDGLTFLERIMEHKPMPVVMVSSLTQKTSRKGLKALELGAVDVIGKPSGDKSDSIRELEDELVRTLKAAAEAHLDTGGRKEKDRGGDVELPDRVDAILIGSSTGGTKALRKVFKDLEAGLPPILICQHMPSVFTEQFAQHLDESSPLDVWEARDGDQVETSQAVVAPGDQHLVVTGRGVKVGLDDGDKRCHQRPAVDPLFETGADVLGNRALGVVMTGMGKDGREGAQALAKKGATILVQSEESCTVYGMPQQVKQAVPEAIDVDLGDMARVLNRCAT